MNTVMRSLRLRWEWAVCAGLALALAAMFLWLGAPGAGGRRFLIAWLASGALLGVGCWVEGRGVVRTYGHLLIAGGFAGFFGSAFAGHEHDAAALIRLPLLAWLLLAFSAAGILWFADARRSPRLGGTGLALAWLGVTLQQFTTSSLAAELLLVGVALRMYQRQRWTSPVWIMLVAIHLGFLLGWPFSEGRIDADRFLELREYWWSLGFFTAAWLAFAHLALRSPDATFSPARRLAFATLNNVLFFGAGVLVVPPSHPAWFWKFSIAAGALLLLAWLFADRCSRLRRAYAVQGTTLIALGLVSALVGREPAALLAVASLFLVLTAEEPRQWLLHYCARLAALMAFSLAWQPVFRSDTPSLWLGVFTGAPLVFNSLWISRHRALWRREAVLFFGALGLGLWMLTTLAQTPAQYHPPILAVEAVIVTASFFILTIREYPYLATTVILLAQFLWFQQVGHFNSRPWWNPCIVVFCTLGLSRWWQTRGRALLAERSLLWLQGSAAGVAVAILVLSIESGFGMTGPALFFLSLLAVAIPCYASATNDRFLFAFGQLLMATAVGEFIGQLTHPPLPLWTAALAPIAALLAMAPALTGPLVGTIWEKPARWSALLYRALAAALFVVWVFHFISPENRFLVLGVVAALGLLRYAHARLFESLICSTGALLAFWMHWLGGQGFRLRDLLGFLLLLAFGQILRRKKMLPEEFQSFGIVVGLGALTQWVANAMNFHQPLLPLAVVWAAVAAVIICVGWWLQEPLYRAFGWSLLGVAFGRVVWVNLVESRLPPGTDPAFRFGLLAIGFATLIAALGYARRDRHPTSS